MVEEPSLQALVDISKHSTLSKRLADVIISTTVYGEADNLRSATARKLFLGGYTNRETLVASGQARDMLVEAFSNVSHRPRVSCFGVLLTVFTAAESPQRRRQRLRCLRQVP